MIYSIKRLAPARSLLAVCCLSAALSGLLLTQFAWAQAPELLGTASLSGDITATRFFGGVSADNGISFTSSFAYDASLDVSVEIQIDPTHVGTTGNLYILLVFAEEIFQRNGPGLYEPWDGSLATLQPAVANKTLESLEVLSILDDVPFGQAGISNAGIDFYVAYDLGSPESELIFHTTPVSLFIEAKELPSQTTYLSQVEPQIVASSCVGCHVEGGVASSSGLILQVPSSADISLSNYNALLNYAQNAPNGLNNLLNKPQGQVAHVGQTQIQPGSQQAGLWQQFLAELEMDLVAINGGGNTSVSAVFDAVGTMSNKETLRKATLLLAGRLPTESELAAIADGSEASLRATIRGAMSGAGFRTFLMESANDRLLTEAFTGNLFNIVDEDRYPNSQLYFQNFDQRDRRQLISRALAEEPLRFIDYIVQQELPYTELLTADYTVMNPYAAEIYNEALQFDDPEDFEDWRPAQITDYFRCSLCRGENAAYDIATNYPHAGVLNSPAFLSRYPSTETNRNRARSRWTYYYFLGVDIEKLAPRTTDQDALQDENNPTLNNPNCTVCHDIMDPVAAAFQFYGDDGFYKDQRGGEHSLPASYRFDSDSAYQIGDTWYADVLPPGFGDALAPQSEDSLQWLGQQLVSDPRFAYGSVYFWYPAIMGRDAYPEPENPSDANYAPSLAAYSEEQTLINEVAADFVAGAAGYGAYNLKDLLVDLIMSEQFRAATVSEQTELQEIELANVGKGRLLTPEQLNRKLSEVMGFDWSYGRSGALGEVYNLVYGGIDSFSITERATDLTTLMSSVTTAMANETACSIVNNDFSKPAAERKLFPYVELASLPTNSASAIRQNMQHLHDVMLGEDLDLNDPELSASVELFESLWEYRQSAGKSNVVSTADEICIFENVENPIPTDGFQTLKSWAGLINYLMRDYRFIYE